MNNRQTKFGLMCGLFLGMAAGPVTAFAFKVDKIEIEGAQRIGYETINSYLPVSIGEDLGPRAVQEGIQRLYKTGFFQDVSFYEREPGILVIQVVERPSIAEIEIEGNSLIKTDDFMQALSAMGIKNGRIYNKVQMDRVIVDLKRRYQNQGYYAAEVSITSKELPRNRVSLKIDVEEGEPASIGAIRLVGNETYSDERLKSLLLLSDGAGLGEGDEYSKPKLQSDLETIKSYYMDRGFAEFEVRSSQVSLSADKKHVFITINVTEGPQYTVESVGFTGEKKLSDQELEQLQNIHASDLFSRSQVIETMNAIRDRLSEEGFAYAEVKPDTTLNKEARTVAIKFDIEPKERVYVRRIEIEGNTRTRDYVIRREMRQLESAPYSLKHVRRSKTRLNRLGFFTKADVETRRVSADQVDLIVKVEEQSTGSFTAGVGYSQLDGVSFNIGVSERNFIGSGNQLDFKVNTSSARKTADIGMTNPYFTDDGVSFGGGFYMSEVDAEQLGVSDYTTNNLGVRASLGYPLSEYSRINYGLKLNQQELICAGEFEDKTCAPFINEYDDMTTSAIMSVRWTYDTKNAFYFPSKGHSFSISGQVETPIDSDIAFYKLFMDEKWYYPLTKNFTLKLKLGLAHGDGLGSYDQLPFYERFYAGGIGSVRGFEPNSLGEKYDLTADGSNRPKGGASKVVSTAALVFPMPFVDDSSNMRVSWFFDAGNVFEDTASVELDELRTATGLGFSWITPVGPLSFSIARPISYTDEDDLQSFQFNLGIPL